MFFGRFNTKFRFIKHFFLDIPQYCDLKTILLSCRIKNATVACKCGASMLQFMHVIPLVATHRTITFF